MDLREFLFWCEEQILSELAPQVIEEIRSSAFVRSHQNRVRNLAGRYASEKMQSMVQFESRAEEFMAVVSYEHDNDVLEYYNQALLKGPNIGGESYVGTARVFALVR